MDTSFSRDFRRAVKWVCLGLGFLAVLAGCSGSSEPVSSASLESSTALTEPTPIATQAETPQPEAAAEPTVAVEEKPTAVAEPTATPAPTATPEPAPTLLLPGGGWQVAFMQSDVFPPTSSGPFSLTYLGTSEGVWGPVAEASFIADIGYRNIGNRGTPYHDVVTTAGAPVRVRTEFAPFSITAVLSVDNGSVVVTSYGLSEADLLVLVDGVSVDERGLVAWDTQTMPARLAPVDNPTASPVFTQYQLQRDDGDSLSLLSVPVGHWQMPLGQRLMHADAEFTLAAGLPALIYGYDSRSRDSSGAVYSDGELFYILEAGPADPSTPGRTMEDISTLLKTLEEVALADIAAELGLSPRSEVIGDWIDNTPLPDTADLTWMLQGPPISPDQEAFFAHQVFGCAWVGEWIESGETVALDQIQASQEWPTAVIMARTTPESGIARRLDVAVESARDISSIDERRTSVLALDCSFLLGPAPQ